MRRPRLPVQPSELNIKGDRVTGNDWPNPVRQVQSGVGEIAAVHVAGAVGRGRPIVLKKIVDPIQRSDGVQRLAGRRA